MVPHRRQIRSRLASIWAGLTLASVMPGSVALAKTPGTTYCFLATCHGVLSIAETVASIGTPTHLIASYYDVPWRDRFNPSLETSSGEIFDADQDATAASPIYPDGTRVLVWEPATGSAAVLRINDAGPYWSNRMLDLSRGAAQKLGIAHRGIGRMQLMVLSAPSDSETRYQRGRRYEPVAGFIGRFESLTAADAAWKAGPDAIAAAREAAAASPLREARPDNRVVNIGRKTTIIVLLPVKLRRPQLLQAAAARHSTKAESNKLVRR